MNAQQIRQKYLEFFESRGHAIIPRAKLLLQDDPTTLFTGSGMQPLLPYLLGKTHPAGQRLTDSQTCLRSQDIEDVGDNRHTTFFEMLGNWSLGDYFKEQQIRWFFEFLTQEVGLDPHKIYVTCFIGDAKYGIPRDDTAAQIWQQVFAEAGMARRRTVTAMACGADEFSFTMTVKTGGAEVDDWIRRQLVIHAVRIVRCFMTLVKKITTRAMDRLIQLAIADVLWKLAIKCLWNIDAWKMVVLSHWNIKMSTLVADSSASQLPNLTVPMYSRVACCGQLLRR